VYPLSPQQIGSIFAFKNGPSKAYEMQPHIRGKDYQTLLTLYNHEVSILQEKLLSGASWEDLKNERRNITELAMALHRSYGHRFSQKMAFGNPAEFPQPDNILTNPWNSHS
jgi:hypothetical protein